MLHRLRSAVELPIGELRLIEHVGNPVVVDDQVGLLIVGGQQPHHGKAHLPIDALRQRIDQRGCRPCGGPVEQPVEAHARIGQLLLALRGWEREALLLYQTAAQDHHQ